VDLVVDRFNFLDWRSRAENAEGLITIFIVSKSGTRTKGLSNLWQTIRHDQPLEIVIECATVGLEFVWFALRHSLNPHHFLPSSHSSTLLRAHEARKVGAIRIAKIFFISLRLKTVPAQHLKILPPEIVSGFSLAFLPDAQPVEHSVTHLTGRVNLSDQLPSHRLPDPATDLLLMNPEE